jgi:hypothetical protein
VFDGVGGKNKKLGILFTLSRKREFNNFLYKISRQIGLSEIYNDNLFPEKPRTNSGNSDLINTNYKYIENEYENLKKNLKEGILHLFLENNNNKSINEIITESTSDFFEFDFILEEYLEDNFSQKLTNTFFNKIRNILNYDFNVFKTEFLILNFPNNSDLQEKLRIFYRENSNEKLKISGNFSDLLQRIDITLPSGTNIVQKINRIIEDYKSEIQNNIDEIDLISNRLRNFVFHFYNLQLFYLFFGQYLSH